MVPVRWLPVVILLLVTVASAAERSEPPVKRGAVWHEQALEIEAMANRSRKPAERHQLLGRAEQTNARALTWARIACRECCTENRDEVLAFYRKVGDLAWRLKRARSKFRAPTDMAAQRIVRTAPNATIRRQQNRRNELRHMRRKAAETPANAKRSARRAQLNRWRRERVAQRLGAAGGSARRACR